MPFVPRVYAGARRKLSEQVTNADLNFDISRSLALGQIGFSIATRVATCCHLLPL